MNHKFKRGLRASAVAALVLIQGAASAQSITETSGVIRRLLVVAGVAGAPGNADLRIWLSTTAPLCAGATDARWAFVNATDSNYKALLATAMLAHANNLTVLISASPGSVGSSTYCQLRWIATPPN